jgi:hypothetical protein
MQTTTVWSALAIAQAVAGGVAWIDPSTFQPNVDALNLYWDSINKRLSVMTAGDYSGTDAINAGSQIDSYVPNGFAIATVGAPPGFSASTSRGSRLAPTISLTGDAIGSFGGYAYLGDGVIVGKAYFEMASIRSYLSGVHATYPGGELRVGSKADNGAYTEWYKLVDKDGHISPIVTGTTKLGLGSKGWGAFYLDYTHAGAAGNIAINKPAGSVLIAAAQQSIVLTNNLITANSIVICTVATDDVTAKSAIAVPAAGSATIKLNAAATAQTKVFFQVIGAD